MGIIDHADMKVWSARERARLVRNRSSDSRPGPMQPRSGQERVPTGRNRESPVSVTTGIWVIVPFVGGLVWLYKVQGALSDFWRSKGA